MAKRKQLSDMKDKYIKSLEENNDTLKALNLHANINDKVLRLMTLQMQRNLDIIKKLENG